MVEQSNKTKPRVYPNIILAVMGCGMIVLAAIGLLYKKDPTVTTAFVVLGAVLVLLSVIVDRLNGPLELGATGLKSHVDAKTLFAVRAGEAEARTGNLHEIVRLP